MQFHWYENCRQNTVVVCDRCIWMFHPYCTCGTKKIIYHLAFLYWHLYTDLDFYFKCLKYIYHDGIMVKRMMNITYLICFAPSNTAFKMMLLIRSFKIWSLTESVAKWIRKCSTFHGFQSAHHLTRPESRHIF